MPRTKEELQKDMGPSMVSGKTLEGIDLAKQASWKSLGCAPSRREACTKCDRSGIWISESMIEDIENAKCARESLTMAMETQLVTSSSLLES